MEVPSNIEACSSTEQLDIQHMRYRYRALICYDCSELPCADSESFVRGGPKCGSKRAIIETPLNDGVIFVGGVLTPCPSPDSGSTHDCWLC